MRPLLAALVLLLPLLNACEGCGPAAGDTGVPGVSDTGEVSAGADAEAVFGPDAAAAGGDAGRDAGLDAGADAGRDAGVDAGASADAGRDAGADAGRDAGADAGADAGRDAGANAGADAGADAGCAVPCGTGCCGPTDQCVNGACVKTCSPACGAGTRCDNGTCVSCADHCAGKTCGSDGCGGTCGSCGASANVCLASGTCGASCTTCPSGSYCTSSSTCGVVDLGNLVFNEPVITVSGKVTKNGAQPLTQSYCTNNPSYTKVRVIFEDKARGYVFRSDVPCSDLTYAFPAIDLFPGTYEVRLYGYTGSDLLAAEYIADPALTLTASSSSLVFDEKVFNVSGRVTLNGAQPATASYCTNNPSYTKVRVLFEDKARRYLFRSDVLCSDLTYGFPSIPIFPGTYEVRLYGYTGSALLAQEYIADPNLALSAGTSSLVFDEKVFAVSGKVTLNGAQPATASYCTNNPSYTKVRVIFEDKARGYLFRSDVLCSDLAYAFPSVSIFPGTYEVRLYGYTGSALLPQEYIVDFGMSLGAATTTLLLDEKVFDVAGRVTRNGVQPTTDSYCTNNPSYTKVRVILEDKARRYVFRSDVPCSDLAYRFPSTPIFPGSYQVRLYGYTGSQLLAQEFIAQDALALSAANPSLVFDEKVITAAGKVTRNGVQPATQTYCTNNPSYTKVRVLFEDKARGYLFRSDVPCSDLAYGFPQIELFPSTYRVFLYGYTGSELLSASYIAEPALALTGSTSGLVFDERILTIGGKVTRNGVQPVTDTYCTNNPSYTKVRVILEDKARGYLFRSDVPCSDLGYAFPPVQVFPGVYQVRLYGYTGSQLLAQECIAFDGLQLP